MRIIAGEFRGRRLQVPGDRNTRPTADRVREAWFSILADRLEDAHVLDLYAGSGALGLEALSRGAKRVEFVEVGKTALNALRANIASLDAEERVTVHRAHAGRFVERLEAVAFDVALADPPYKGESAKQLVGAFEARPFARVLGIEHRGGEDIGGDETRRYGGTALTFCYAP